MFSELQEFSKMNTQNHVLNQLSIKTLKAHQTEFKRPNIIFLSILTSCGNLAGYIILFVEKRTNIIHLKRILVDENHLGIGIGVRALLAMETYCLSELKANRVWLDVFKSNEKALHIYQKLGYKVFKKGMENCRHVLFYEKKL
ncbi:MAG: GNAT family N-acetyltransferase [Cycloclasticus sp.]|nr:GNAT family N-acetyltransferase [Cycloclasticus sp.]